MNKQPIGIICAIPEERAAFGKHFKIDSQTQIGDAVFYSGAIDGRAVVLVECGIGKVNAAFAATILCHHYQTKQIIFSGIAGGIDPALNVGDVVVATELVQYDYGRLQQGEIIAYRPGIPPLPFIAADNIGYTIAPGLVAGLKTAFAAVKLPDFQGRTPQLDYGMILTGDVFLNDTIVRETLFEQYAAKAIEMEGGAITQVAEKFGADVVIIRALSDLAGDDSHLDFVEFGGYAAEICIALVLAALKIL